MATLENCKTAEIIEKINGCRICCDCSSENEYNIFVKEDGIKKFYYLVEKIVILQINFFVLNQEENLICM